MTEVELIKELKLACDRINLLTEELKEKNCNVDFCVLHSENQSNNVKTCSLTPKVEKKLL